jgi:hypothetical protein
MKIRTGFVSNSSSSSYVVFCNSLSLKDLFHKNYKYTPYAEASGGDGVNQGVKEVK